MTDIESNNSSKTTPLVVAMEPLDGELDGASLNQLSVKNVKSIKELYMTQWQRLRSWGTFADTTRMKTPNSSHQWSRRLIRNVEHFQSNYLCVFLVLVIYCVLSSPLLLLAISASLGACYIVLLKNAESPLKIFGYQLSLTHQYLFVLLMSFPLFHLAGAGSAVFWVLGASAFVIGLHASIYAIEMQDSLQQPVYVPFPIPNPIQNV